MVKITDEMWAAKRARSIFTTQKLEERMGANDYEDLDWATMELFDTKETRVDRALLERLRSNPKSFGNPAWVWKEIDDFEMESVKERDGNEEDPERVVGIMLRTAALARAAIKREEGNVFFKAGKYEDAIGKYLEAVQYILGPLEAKRNGTDTKVIVPSPQYYSPLYLDIGQRFEESLGMWMEYMDLLALKGNIAQAYHKLGKYIQAIDWLEEALQLFICVRQNTKDKPSWKDSHFVLVDYWHFRIKTHLRGYTIFSALGNTSLAAAFGHQAWKDYSMLNTKRYPKLAALDSDVDPVKMFVYRHPEPNMIDKIKVTCPEIQVRGTWEKLLPITQGGLRPNGRCAHSSWVWRGRLYICSGVNEYQMEIKDMWYLDLKTNIWKQLPSPPTKRPIAGLSSVRPTRVWRDKVYLFVGTQNLHVFDLVTEQWSTLKTTMQRGQTWPYSVDGALTASASALLDDKLYIFGGEDGGDPLGQNIFMALDLTTAKWTHVSGTSANIPKSFEPNLRTLPCMWASPLHRKIYLLYGSANRTQARLQHKPGSGEYDYTYEDFWSWDVDAPSSSSSSSGIQSRWTRERLRGNFPSPRTEAASVYWDATGRAVVYGGYHGSLPTIELNVSIGNQQPMYDFTFFGDTFVHDPETNVWQHVLVRGFPSYRAMATIASDPDTGKVYLFGGYTNPDFVPAKNITGRVYHDVWTLKLDLPGGNWNPEDLHRDMRAEKMGPWMRCFTCGNCGISWQKCAGACGGKYYFCSKECQKAGWKEHKEKHGCKKL